jgi:hypothetical protein
MPLVGTERIEADGTNDGVEHQMEHDGSRHDGRS